MDSISGLSIAASALTAQRLRMDVISSNIANAETTRTAEGGPYRRTQVVFTPVQATAVRGASSRGIGLASSGTLSQVGEGVAVSAIVEDQSPFEMSYDPTHPDADEQGYVSYPNVDITTEMADMLSATRAYEANVTVVNALKSMALKSLEIGRG